MSIPATFYFPLNDKNIILMSFFYHLLSSSMPSFCVFSAHGHSYSPLWPGDKICPLNFLFSIPLPVSFNWALGKDCWKTMQQLQLFWSGCISINAESSIGDKLNPTPFVPLHHDPSCSITAGLKVKCRLLMLFDVNNEIAAPIISHIGYYPQNI